MVLTKLLNVSHQVSHAACAAGSASVQEGWYRGGQGPSLQPRWCCRGRARTLWGQRPLGLGDVESNQPEVSSAKSCAMQGPGHPALWVKHTVGKTLHCFPAETSTPHPPVVDFCHSTHCWSGFLGPSAVHFLGPRREFFASCELHSSPLASSHLAQMNRCQMTLAGTS